tara:strand:- start:1649 stop:2236 length:588 start_codon:yes stop_codon:yes gene_type:complete
MIVSEKFEFVFVSTPKTGTHTMYEMLPRLFGAKQQEGPYHRLDIPEKFQDFFTFTTVRNPFERMVSIWHALIERDNYRPIFLPLVGTEDFEGFVKWLTSLSDETKPKGKGGVLMHTQSYWLRNTDLDDFLQIEDVDAQFSKLNFVKNSKIDIPTLPKVLARKHLTWKDVQSDRCREMIVNWARDDFINFNYDENY